MDRDLLRRNQTTADIKGPVVGTSVPGGREGTLPPGPRRRNWGGGSVVWVGPLGRTRRVRRAHPIYPLVHVVSVYGRCTYVCPISIYGIPFTRTTVSHLLVLVYTYTM